MLGVDGLRAMIGCDFPRNYTMCINGLGEQVCVQVQSGKVDL